MNIATPTASPALDALAGSAVDVILRDDGTLRLPPPTRRDEEGLLAFLRGLSEESRYLRFTASYGSTGN